MSTEATRLREYLSVAIEAARRGAAELERWRSKFSVREKSRADLVTDADTASQKIVKDILLDAFPDHVFIGEEESVGKSPEDVRPPSDAPPAWVVDPLDGTANYVHDVPAYCVSIGLWHAGKAIVGVILDPRQNELFSAADGLGAFLNDKPIRVSTVPGVTDGMISTGFPANYQKQLRNLEAWTKLTEHAQSLRRNGSTALSMAYVASGRFDGYWAYDNYPWDVMAGAALIAEAGGVLSTTDGKPFDPYRPDLVAGNPGVHPELLRILLS
ncbi:inositol monophosphatase [Gemmata sp. G18]|uniref:Inositol-1-monophosphatase n=1 Tax=Gemmata palustris TaxID=2822762 RepID=A0ABS5BZV9_9BACT|nr:inositol monophosphatase family protein [Gemmata palustris]MBP3959175.1 inositol monophosphatase [Gemmata palustris]